MIEQSEVGRLVVENVDCKYEVHGVSSALNMAWDLEQHVNCDRMFLC